MTTLPLHHKLRRPSNPSPLSSELHSEESITTLSALSPLSTVSPSPFVHAYERHDSSALSMDEYEEEEEGAELEAYREKALRNSDSVGLQHHGDHASGSHASGSGHARFNGATGRTQAGMVGEGFEPFRTGSPIPDADGLGWPGSFPFLSFSLALLLSVTHPALSLKQEKAH